MWTDISEVLQMTMKRINALKLNRAAWAADGLIPFDRRVAVGLAAAEADEAEDASERLMRSVCIDPRGNTRQFARGNIERTIHSTENERESAKFATLSRRYPGRGDGARGPIRRSR